MLREMGWRGTQEFFFMEEEGYAASSKAALS